MAGKYTKKTGIKGRKTIVKQQGNFIVAFIN